MPKKKKIYEVRLRVTLSGTVCVEADSEEEARCMAADEVDRDFYSSAEMVDWEARNATEMNY